MFELYGITYELYNQFSEYSDPDGEYVVRVLIATFDTKEAAKAYVEESFVPPVDRLYKRNPYHPASVLGAYRDYEIVKGAGIPHNPIRNW
jgi:hypothetical protein